MGTYIIWTTLESVGDAFPGNKSDLYKLFASTIKDPESAEVRVNTMLALSRLAMLLEPEEDPKELVLFQDAIPGMVTVLKSTVEEGDEVHKTTPGAPQRHLLMCSATFHRTMPYRPSKSSRPSWVVNPHSCRSTLATSSSL